MYHEILKVSPKARQDEIDAAFRREVALIDTPMEQASSETMVRGLALMHAWVALSAKKRQDRLVVAVQRRSLRAERVARDRKEHDLELDTLLKKVVHHLKECNRDLLELRSQEVADRTRRAALFDTMEKRFNAEIQQLQTANAELVREATERRQRIDRTEKLQGDLAEQKKNARAATAALEQNDVKIRQLTAQVAAQQAEILALREKECASRVKAEVDAAQNKLLAAEVAKLQTELAAFKKGKNQDPV